MQYIWTMNGTYPSVMSDGEDLGLSVLYVSLVGVPIQGTVFNELSSGNYLVLYPTVAVETLSCNDGK